MQKKLVMGMISLLLVCMLSACTTTSDKKSQDINQNDSKNQRKMVNQHNSMDAHKQGMEDMNKSNVDHNNMMHVSSGKLPKGLNTAKNPTYKVGDQAMIRASHMNGMNGATATIVGAFDTTAYMVTFTPTTGGVPVKHHKWVVQEEIKNAGTGTLKPGTKVILEADHMPGMEGATATIESTEKTTVYMVDFVPPTGEGTVKYHKWVTESELTTK